MDRSLLLSQRMRDELEGKEDAAAETWAKIFELAALPNIVQDLGQGRPLMGAPPVALQAAASVIAGDKGDDNQYAPTAGTKELREAIALHYAKRYNAQLDPAENIIVSTSATEALYAALVVLVDQGDEVVIFEPYFPWYLSMIRQVGGVPKIVTLNAPSFEWNSDELKAAFTSRTKAVIFNSPQNPTGKVFSAAETAELGRICVETNTVCLSDEVYEDFVFGDGCRHLRMADQTNMADLTLTVSSAAKKLCLSGWRVGWMYGPADLIKAARVARGYITFASPTPLQHGVAVALSFGGSARGAADGADDKSDSIDAYIGGLCDTLKRNKDVMVGAFKSIGVTPLESQGGYYLVCDVSNTGKTDMEFCVWLANEKGVVVAPMSVFYCKDKRSDLVRVALCKTSDNIQMAADAIMARSTTATHATE